MKRNKSGDVKNGEAPKQPCKTLCSCNPTFTPLIVLLSLQQPHKQSRVVLYSQNQCSRRTSHHRPRSRSRRRKPPISNILSCQVSSATRQSRVPLPVARAPQLASRHIRTPPPRRIRSCPSSRPRAWLTAPGQDRAMATQNSNQPTRMGLHSKAASSPHHISFQRPQAGRRQRKRRTCSIRPTQLTSSGRQRRH